jgi:hypothetical protein
VKSFAVRLLSTETHHQLTSARRAWFLDVLGQQVLPLRTLYRMKSGDQVQRYGELTRLARSLPLRLKTAEPAAPKLQRAPFEIDNMTSRPVDPDKGEFRPGSGLTLLALQALIDDGPRRARSPM